MDCGEQQENTQQQLKATQEHTMVTTGVMHIAQTEAATITHVFS